DGRVGVGLPIQRAVAAHRNELAPTEVGIDAGVVQAIAHAEIAGAGRAALLQVAVERFQRQRVHVDATVGQRVAVEVLRQRRQAQRERFRRRPQQLRAATTYLGVVDVLLAGGNVVDV